MPWPLKPSEGNPAYQCPAVRYPRITTAAFAIYIGLLNSIGRRLYFTYSVSWWTVIRGDPGGMDKTSGRVFL